MPVFTYTALDTAGKETTGTVTADGRSAALNQLAGQGLHPVTVEERQDAAKVLSAERLATGRVSQASLETFTRQLANLLAAGVPLSRALQVLSREASQPAARRQWVAIHDDVVGGTSLGDALARFPRTFPPVYVAMVRAGETGGFLDLVLSQIADFRSREQELKGKVKAALVYPAVLATLATGVLTFLLTYFIPRFSAIFAEFGGALPGLTRAIVAASNLVVRHGVVVLIAAVLVVLVMRRLLASDTGRRRIEGIILALPAVGSVVARFALVRFCRMLGTLLGAGVPLVPALRVAREAIGNQILADTVTQAVNDVQHGASLARSLAESRQLFPPAVVEMVVVAEESGRLNDELVRIAAAYESELDRRLRMLVALAEPALLFIMAGVVGTVVIGMLLPVFTLQDLIR
ncbi:MAG TPA: type II secretion system F family protein [Planctomycetota bacterium]|nr:type II secretion system F family protein [Planctomycetota bacterium]